MTNKIFHFKKLQQKIIPKELVTKLKVSKIRKEGNQKLKRKKITIIGKA